MQDSQVRQKEWHEQWAMLRDSEPFLFEDWIYRLTLKDLAGKTVLECGCGGGQHTSFMAPYAESVTAVDLNTVPIAIARNENARNVEFIEADIATMDLGRQFDVVISVGVVHHTDDPDRTVRNLTRHVKPGGRLVLWVYSEEGNALVSRVVEPVRKAFLANLSRSAILRISQGITAMLYPIIHSAYRMDLPGLPYYEYFANFRKLSFARNVLNVFDKLNAPQVQFIERARAEKWFNSLLFDDVHISPYCNVSWRCSGTLRAVQPDLNLG